MKKIALVFLAGATLAGCNAATTRGKYTSSSYPIASAPPVTSVSLAIIPEKYMPQQSERTAPIDATNSSCKVVPPRSVTSSGVVVYRGTCKNGYAEGIGSAIYFENGKEKWVVRSEFRQGAPSGQWIFIDEYEDSSKKRTYIEPGLIASEVATSRNTAYTILADGKLTWVGRDGARLSVGKDVCDVIVGRPDENKISDGWCDKEPGGSFMWGSFGTGGGLNDDTAHKQYAEAMKGLKRLQNARKVFDEDLKKIKDVSDTSRLTKHTQSALAASGYYKGKTDGVLSDDTKRAILMFVGDSGFSGSSEPTYAMLSLIKSGKFQNSRRQSSPQEDGECKETFLRESRINPDTSALSKYVNASCTGGVLNVTLNCHKYVNAVSGASFMVNNMARASWYNACTDRKEHFDRIGRALNGVSSVSVKVE